MFVVTNNNDGTMTRLDFPGNDFTKTPTLSTFASGGYRGDLTQVGSDGCAYITQDGTHYPDGTTTGENSVVRICGGFSTGPGVGNTTLTTSLSGGGESGSSISVPPNTAVTDSSVLKGKNVGRASGTVTYSVFSDSQCLVPAADGGTVSVTKGSVPSSNAVTLANAGTYYWRAAYSGDAKNSPSTSTCGDGIETVGGSSHHDDAPPVCVLLKVTNGPPESLTVDVEDNRSGIETIDVVGTTNATVKVPAFTSGTNGRNLVRLFKTDQTIGSAVRLSATDVAGNTHDCSFVFFVVNGKSKQSMNGVDPVDSTIDIVNYGLPNLSYSVDGAHKLVTLKPSQNKFIQAGRLFTKPSNNSVNVVGHCTGLADVVFFDGSLPGNPTRSLPQRVPRVEPDWCAG